MAIFGGAKVSDKIELIQNFLGKADAILIGGAMSFTFLKAQGFQIGKSLCEEDKLDLALDLLKQAGAKGTRLLLPLDHRGRLRVQGGCRLRHHRGPEHPRGPHGPGHRPRDRGRLRSEIRAREDPALERPHGRLRDGSLTPPAP